MLFKTEVTATANLSSGLKSKVKFGKCEFNVVPEFVNNSCAFHVQDEKGEFEILYVINTRDMSTRIPYDHINKRFVAQHGTYNVVISADIEYEKTEKKDTFVKINYQLFISSDYMKSLKLYEYNEDYIVLPNYPKLKFKRYIKKIKEASQSYPHNVEICIENPFEVEIGYGTGKGKKEDFKQMAIDSENFESQLFFVFSDEDLKKYDVLPQVTQNNAAIAAPPAPHTSLNIQKPLFYEIMSSTKYADVQLVTENGEIVPTHRCVLAKYSVIFDKMFEKTKETPVKIRLEKFDVDTVTAAMNFCYGKTDCISGKAEKLLEFANAFAINELKDACCYYCNEQVDTSNVCEVIQIAYSHNLEELKQNCKKIMIEKKAEIDHAKLKALPKDILFDVYF